ncbi:MAG: YdcH family protein [Pseudomonadota bacterium]
MSEQDHADLRLRYAKLRQDHNDLGAAIDAMTQVGCPPLQIQRMKKKKLAVKDEMTRLEDQFRPDIIA